MRIARRAFLLSGISAAIIRPGILMPIKPGRWELVAVDGTRDYGNAVEYLFTHSLTGNQSGVRVPRSVGGRMLALQDTAADVAEIIHGGERVYIPETFRVLQRRELENDVRLTYAAITGDDGGRQSLNYGYGTGEGHVSGGCLNTRPRGRGAPAAARGPDHIEAAVFDHAVPADDLLARHREGLLRGLRETLAPRPPGDAVGARDQPSGRGSGLAPPDPQGALAGRVGSEPRDGLASRRQLLRRFSHDR